MPHAENDETKQMKIEKQLDQIVENMVNQKKVVHFKLENYERVGEIMGDKNMTEEEKWVKYEETMDGSYWAKQGLT